MTGRALLTAILAIVPVRSVVEPPTLWLVGDSTVRNGSGDGRDGRWGWGEPLARLFDTQRIRIVNRAIGGRSSRTFLTDGRWDAILAEAEPGDFVLIQFGHNDPAPLNDGFRSRGTICGLGDETQEIDNLVTKKHEVVHTYGWYMRKYVRDAKEHGLTPVVCSYVPRCPCPGTPVADRVEPESYRLWAQRVAEAEGAFYIDLFGLVWAEYAKLSPEEIRRRYFTGADFTHTNAAGAEVNARMVAIGIRALPDCPLAKYLIAPRSVGQTRRVSN